MIDPTNVTKYNRTEKELQEFLLFSIAVAGKRADTTAKNLSKLIDGKGMPFDVIKNIKGLANTLKKHGFGCYNLKAKGFKALVKSGLNLRTCTLEDLVKIPGIGFKTATFFLLHTRENANVACLDTHILRWMKDQGYKNLPKVSPQSIKTYTAIQDIFLSICKVNFVKPEVLDLAIWNLYSGSITENMDWVNKLKKIARWESCPSCKGLVHLNISSIHTASHAVQICFWCEKKNAS